MVIDGAHQKETAHEFHLLKKLAELEKETELLKRQIRRYKTTKAAGFVLIFSGIFCLILVIFYPSNILVLASLGPLFLGGILLYVRPTKYVRYELLRESNMFICALMDKIIKNLGYESKGIYLPPKTLKGLMVSLVFMPKKNKIIIPPVQTSGESDLFSKNPEGIYLPSPGSNLFNLFREWVGKDPSGLTLSEVGDKLTAFLIENLELVKNAHVEFKDDRFLVRFIDPVYMELCEEIRGTFQTCSQVGCPFCSFVACLLTQVTGHPVLIDHISYGEKEIETSYQIVKG